MNWIAFAAAAVTAAFAFAGTFLSNRKTTALMVYRLEQLERKVDAHNGFDKRLTIVETQLKTLENTKKE